MIYLIVIGLLGISAGANDSFLFHTNKCPVILKEDFKSQIINENQSKLKINILWNKDSTEEPYAAIIPDAFRIASLQIMEALNKNGLSAYAPNSIELYSLGEKLPSPLSSFTAILCGSMQDKNTMRLLVNDAFLYHAITFKRKLAHELFHYISQILDKSYPHWLEEGMAIQFESLLTGSENIELGRFHMMESPWIPLVPKNKLQTVDDKRSFYGHAYLFVRYLYKKQPDQFYANILNTKSSIAEDLFIDLKGAFSEFSIAKYINTFDYFGPSLNDREKYILIDGAEVNRRLSPILEGNLLASTSANPGQSYWLTFENGITISKTPISNATRIYIKY